MSNKYGAIVSHTHWDREWYQPFQTYRKRLVYMVDDLIETLENNKEYRSFFFDGQTIVLEDYLDIKPENKERLENVIKEGRIEIGPWYVMPDEFLISGEALIRNILKGHQIANDFDVEACKCGYVCDIFGHNSQFPQILNGFGIDTAVFYRGVKGNSIPSEVFWESPDGSRVFGAKLEAERSYSDFYFAIRWPFDNREYEREELVDRMRKLIAHKAPLQFSDVYLLLDGVDHIEIEHRLPWIIEVLNEAFEDMEFHHETMEGYFNKLKEANINLPVLKGELIEHGYKGVNNQVLANVLSSRIDIKKQNDCCQELIEKWAEPMSVFAQLNGREYPYGFLNKSWEYIMKNHPHDSICGCSIGQVHRDMNYRFDQSNIICTDIVKDSINYIVDQINTQNLKGERVVTVFNNSEIEKQEVVIIDLLFNKNETTDNIRIFDEMGNMLPYQILDFYENIDKVHTVRQLIDFPHQKLVKVALILKIPAMGYQTLSYEGKSSSPLKHGDYSFEEFIQPKRYEGTMQVGHNKFENEHLVITVNSNGCIDVYDKATQKQYRDLLLIEDRGEVGEGWNYKKPLKDSIYSSNGVNANISVEADGINLVTIKIRYKLNIPCQIAMNNRERSNDFVDIYFTHEITLKKNSKQLDIKTIINNTAKDHIIKLLLPSHLKTDDFYTNTPFDIIKRSFIRPDRTDYTEIDTKVSPSQGFMKINDDEGGFAVFTKGIYEYEAYKNEERTMALTLMRCFRNEVGTLGGIDGQLLGENTFEYALRFYSNEESNLYKEYNHFKAGTRLGYTNKHTGVLPTADSYMNISNDHIIYSCFKRSEKDEDSYILRVFNIKNSCESTEISFNRSIKECYYVNLNEEKESEISNLEINDNKIIVNIDKNKIVSLKMIF